MNSASTHNNIDTTFETPQEVLRQVFGFEEFRPLQQQIIDNVIQKRDTLAVMPTGGGKSLCYQIPALIFDGLTVVVSPLISLMKDQVDQLTAYGISAAYLNSTLSMPEYEDILRQITHNEIDLLYLAPETLMKDQITRRLSDARIDCFAIDEAHCISEWGHDFRPEYRQLAHVKERFDGAVTLALTATATPRVQGDIAQSLSLADVNRFVASFDRTNLFLNVAEKSDPLEQTISFLEDHRNQSGIIYCFSRKQVDELAADLNKNGFSTLPYHAGLSEQDRSDHQEAFIRDEVDIIVATIAFGMGIDKPDVRFVVHHDMPKNIESYYQQIGRAGRDGLNSDCLFLFGYKDVSKINYFISQKSEEEARVARDHLEQLLNFAETRTCRRKPLLNYFGESYETENCEMCDNCTGDNPDLQDLTVPAQKFLSTIARTDQRFGFNHIKFILTGADRKKIRDLGHDRLSTYGIGQELSKGQWKQLYRELMRQNVIIKDSEYGSLKFTEKALPVLKGDEKIMGIIDEDRETTSKAASKSEIESLPVNRDLFKLLKQKRTDLARQHDVPPYVIFPDTTLIEMAHYLPQSSESLLTMHGVGAAKSKKFGPEFLDLIREFCSAHDLKENPKSGVDSGHKRTKSRSKNKSFHKSGRAFNAGSTVAEIAEQKDIKESTVFSHLVQFVKDGEALNSNNLISLSNLSETDIQRVREAFSKHGTDLLRPVFEELNEEISYDDIRIVQLDILSKTENG